jgi:hypothetical protein
MSSQHAAAMPATEHYEFTWRGLSVRAAYAPGYCGGPGDKIHVAHLQIWNDTAREPLPMSETGYRSLFLPNGEVEHAGGVVAYATLWLEAASLRPEWKAIERDRRQGSLF